MPKHLDPPARPPAPGEDEFLRSYDPGSFPRPSVAVDLVVLTIRDTLLRVLLVRRKEHPFQGCWALPGGFVRVGDGRDNQGEDLEAAAARELKEETGLSAEQVYLEQLGAFGRANRDPRMRVITVAYYALVRPDLAPMVQAGGDAADTDWYVVSELAAMSLAFDHRQIIDAALRRIADQIEHGDIAFQLVPATFTIPELRSVFETVRGVPYDPGNFRRRFNRMLEDGVLERAPGKRVTASKPAQVYRFKRRSSGG